MIKTSAFGKDPAKDYCDGLYARVSVDKKFYQVPVELRRQRPVPVDGATSYIYRKMVNGTRTVTKLGRDLDEAFVLWRNLDADAERVKQGKAPLHEVPVSDKPARQTVAGAVDAYLEKLADDLAKNKRRPNTVDAYSRAARQFREYVQSVPVVYMDEISREVLLGYETWQYKNLRRKNCGKRENTIVNNFRYLNAFLGVNGIKMVKDKRTNATDRGVMNYLDMPKASEKVVDSYSPEEIRMLMDAATPDEADIIQFFLKTGCRDAEVMHAQWSDIEKKKDGSGYEFHVQEKLINGWNWKPKNKSDRKIDLSTKLYDRLMERKSRVGISKHGLIFPNEAGNPDTHLISRLKSVWSRVQLAAEKEGHAGLTGRPELHKFRRTFITGMLANQVPPQDVMNYSGHTDYKSFQRYMSVNTKLGKAGIERMSDTYGD